MHFFITGATGLLGSTLVSDLVKKGHQLTCLIYRQNFHSLKSVKKVKGDLLNYQSLLKATQSADIIIHAAASINEKKSSSYYQINYQGTLNLLKAAKKNKIKQFVYISSWAVNLQAGAYAHSKYLAEKEVKKFPHYLIIRPADIYNFKKSHLLNLIKLIKKLPAMFIISDGKYQVSPIYVNDLAKIIMLLIEQKVINKTYTITGPQIYTFKQIVDVILKQSEVKKRIIFIPKNLIYPFVFLADKLNIPFPLNIEQYQRLTTDKVISNRFDFEKIKFEPLSFEKALNSFIL